MILSMLPCLAELACPCVDIVVVVIVVAAVFVVVVAVFVVDVVHFATQFRQIRTFQDLAFFFLLFSKSVIEEGAKHFSPSI